MNNELEINKGATRHPRRCNGTSGNGKEEEELELIRKCLWPDLM